MSLRPVSITSKIAFVLLASVAVGAMGVTTDAMAARGGGVVADMGAEAVVSTAAEAAVSMAVAVASIWAAAVSMAAVVAFMWAVAGSTRAVEAFTVSPASTAALPGVLSAVAPSVAMLSPEVRSAATRSRTLAMSDDCQPATAPPRRTTPSPRIRNLAAPIR